MSGGPPETKELVDEDLFGVIVLATGMVALFSVVMFGLGALIGMAGVMMGAIALARRNRSKGLAAIGTGLSALAIVLGSAVVFGLYYYFEKSGFAELLELGDSGYEYDDLSYWEGVVAPPLTGELLDGAPFDLADYRGKKVVLYGIAYTFDLEDVDLDTQSAQLDAVQESARRQGQDFITVGVFAGAPDEFDSEFGTIDWEFPVAIVEGAPLPYSELLRSNEVVLVIDAKGVVQHVFMDDTSEDDLVEAATSPDYAGIGADLPPSVSTGLEVSKSRLEAALEWQIPTEGACGIAAGPWHDPASGDVIVVKDCSVLVRVDELGVETELFELPESFGTVRLGRYNGGVRVLNGEPYGETVQVIDETGGIAWTVEGAQTISEAFWLDLDADGNDEVIYVEYDPAQIHAVDKDGGALWSVTSAENVGDAAGLVLPDGDARIIVTEYDSIGVYDRRGSNHTRHDVPGDWIWRIFGAEMIDATHWQVLASGDESLLALDETFALQWAAEGLDEHFGHGFPCADINGDGRSEWAVPLQRGEVAIVSSDGKEMCRVRHEPVLMGLMLSPRTENAPGRLLALTGSGLASYALTSGEAR